MQNAKLIVFELKKNLFNSKNIAVLIVLPLLVVVLFNFAFKDLVDDKPIIKIGLIDEENTSTSRYLVEQLLKDEDISNLINIETVEGNKEIEKIKNKEYNGIFKIPVNFTSNLINMKNTPIEIIYNKNDPLTSYALDVVTDSFSLYIEEVQKHISSTYYTTKELNNLNQYTEKINNNISLIMIGEVFNRKLGLLKNELEDIPSTSSPAYLIIMIEILILSFTTLFFIYKYKEEKKINDKLKTIGIKSWRIKILKTISYMILINLQIVLVYIPIFYYLTKTFEIEKIIFLNLIVFFMLGMWFFISSLIKKSENFILLGSLIIIFSNLFGGTLFPIVLMTYRLKFLSKFTINYWFGKEFLLLSNENADYSILLITAILALAFYFLSERGDELNA